MSGSPLARLCGPLAILTLAVGAAAAQRPEPVLGHIEPAVDRGPWRTSPADSARFLSGARSAQSRFESVRRHHLPWTWNRGGGPCDERIGRFCLWYGDGESTWKPPPDPEPVVAARGVLIARLDTAAAVIPGDWWVAGQRVRYLLEAERPDDAVAAARACRSPDPGWCDALLGYALHQQGDYPAADAAFAAALAALPPRERRRWTDLAPLLEPDAQRAYRRLGEAERAEFEARFWWLADPLHMVEGNDRRTEHFARHVVDRLQDRARQTEGISWGSDLRELLIRYGSPAGWERIRTTAPSLDANGMVTRYPTGARRFDPSLGHLREPTRIAPDGWDLNPKAARSSYAPAYAAPVEVLDYQLGTFRRGDSARVVAALWLKPDSLGARPAADAALLLWTEPETPPRSARARAAERPAVTSLQVPTEPGLLSLEVLAREERRAARARFGLPLEPLPRHGLALSSLLLLDEADALPVTLDEALPHLRGTLAVRPGERLVLFWETYGLSPADLPLDVSVQLLDENAGWLRRAAERRGLVGRRTPLAVRWQEAPGDPGAVHGRSVLIELPELAPGAYSLEVAVTARGREALRASQRVTVEE